ncbi:hypothetical protein NWP17_14910 [Chrysosporum bergii ANA360D]|uniref:Uncharacterized protein n=1 Tax=Chrysosporum bergii ANA360D TaxID=617107 RepID=A0AA43KCP9_9CYAN|nr:hypothetical protein [Chrysosporum bergii]MDH6061707.1 hypothetical protein [Chrysosporum bergii ANA360D]
MLLLDLRSAEVEGTSLPALLPVCPTVAFTRFKRAYTPRALTIILRSSWQHREC